MVWVYKIRMSYLVRTDLANWPDFFDKPYCRKIVNTLKCAK